MCDEMTSFLSSCLLGVLQLQRKPRLHAAPDLSIQSLLLLKKHSEQILSERSTLLFGLLLLSAEHFNFYLKIISASRH